MRKKIFLTTFILFIFSTASYAQIVDSIKKDFSYSIKKDFSLLVGFNQGRYSFVDIGFALNKYGANRHPFSFDYFISNEFKIGNKTVIGPKVGVWVAGGFAMGLNMIYYTDFDNNSLAFRPEIGIGIAKAKLVYGYNWKLTNKSFRNISTHLIGLTYCFRLKSLQTMSLTNN